MSELIEGYRRALSSSLSRLAGVAGETVLVEETVAGGSPVAQKTVAEINWPPGTVVVTVQRRSHLLFPQGATRLEPGDVVNALTRAEQGERLRALVCGITPDEGEAPEERGPDLI
jgi:Trk K+ transport system NAD-binding subunit